MPPLPGSSTTDTLKVTSGGQANVTAVDKLINNITVTVPPGGTFLDFIINPGCPPGSHDCGTANVTVDANNPAGTFTFAYTLGNGQNFLTITATVGETIFSVTFDDTTGFQDFNQPRISGLGGDTTVTPVPEPSAMLLLGSGLIGLAGYGRKKFFKK